MAINNQAPAGGKKALAEQLGVSRSSLYYQPTMPAKDLSFKQEIEKVMKNNPAYGHKRIAIALCKNKKKVLRVMKLFGLKPIRRRRKPNKIEDTKKEPMKIPNLLTDYKLDDKNKVWVSDFTYLPYQGKFVYLATVMDAFTREIIGWDVSTRHNTELIMKAAIDALEKNPFPEIIHSDQGSEYRNKLFIDFLKEKQIKVSMSKKASPWENGYQESYYSGFKLDLGHPDAYPSLGELIARIAETIGYYNQSRIHTALKMPPATFASRLVIKNLSLSHLTSNSLLV